MSVGFHLRKAFDTDQPSLHQVQQAGEPDQPSQQPRNPGRPQYHDCEEEQREAQRLEPEQLFAPETLESFVI